jgi:hypothetical protein
LGRPPTFAGRPKPFFIESTGKFTGIAESYYIILIQPIQQATRRKAHASRRAFFTRLKTPAGAF